MNRNIKHTTDRIMNEKRQQQFLMHLGNHLEELTRDNQKLSEQIYERSHEHYENMIKEQKLMLETMSIKEKELQKLGCEVKNKNKIKENLSKDFLKYQKENTEALKNKQKAIEHFHKMQVRQRSLKKEIKEQSQVREESAIINLKLKYLTDTLKDIESKIKCEELQTEEIQQTIGRAVTNKQGYTVSTVEEQPQSHWRGSACWGQAIYVSTEEELRTLNEFNLD